jgi:hypothetical protein
VTPPTSSPSAKPTLKMVAVEVDSGTRPTDQSFESTLNAMLEARKMSNVRMSDVRYAIWNVWGKIKHVVGLHTYVPLEEWDPNNGSMQYTGMVCWHCTKELR